MCVSYEYIEKERKKYISQKKHGKFKYETDRKHKRLERERNLKKFGENLDKKEVFA